MPRKTRILSLLAKIHDGLERFIDQANKAEPLDLIAITMSHTVQSAAQYLYEDGLTADARQLENVAHRLLHDVMGIALHDVAKKFPPETKELWVEHYRLAALAEDDPKTREYRLRSIVGTAVEFRDLTEEIVSDIKADDSRLSQKESTHAGEVCDATTVGKPGVSVASVGKLDQSQRVLVEAVFDDVQTDLDACFYGQNRPQGDSCPEVKNPPLGERCRLALEAMRELTAFDSDHRSTTEEIARQATGPEADGNSFKEVMVKLKKHGYVDTREGRGGGCWLTDDGCKRAENCRKL